VNTTFGNWLKEGIRHKMGIEYAGQEEHYAYVRFESGITLRVGRMMSGNWLKDESGIALRVVRRQTGWYAEASSVKEDYCICRESFSREQAATEAVSLYREKCQ
jgi:hypothetical protein